MGERGWGKGDGILKPVLSKLCRSILISLLYIFFFSINELVSIIVDPHGDNIKKILREPLAFKNFSTLLQIVTKIEIAR